MNKSASLLTEKRASWLDLARSQAQERAKHAEQNLALSSFRATTVRQKSTLINWFLQPVPLVVVVGIVSLCFVSVTMAYVFYRQRHKTLAVLPQVTVTEKTPGAKKQLLPRKTTIAQTPTSQPTVKKIKKKKSPAAKTAVEVEEKINLPANDFEGPGELIIEQRPAKQQPLWTPQDFIRRGPHGSGAGHD